MKRTVCLLVAAILSSSALPADQDLSPNDEQIAKDANLLPLYRKLQASLASPKANPVQLLLIRQRLLERVTSASLQVEATTARIDGEIAEAKEFSNILSAKRDHKENLLNVAGIATGGATGIVSSALQLSAKHAKAGNSVGIGAGVIISVISVMSLRAQAGKRQEFNFRSNMLAQLFNRPADDTDVYSPEVLAFLDAVPAVDPDKLSRRQRLIRTWTDAGRIEDPKTPRAQTKIAHLTGTYQHDYPLSISELDDRRAMLEDLRAKLSLMKRDLASFLSKLPEGPAVID